MSARAIRGWLSERLGLDADALDERTLARVVRRCMRELGVRDVCELWQCVRTSHRAAERLIDAVVVPESWFFRYPESYTLLAEHVAACTAPARLLSVPCAAGEEPYSMAMCLLEHGLGGAIDAADVSAACLARARRGRYGARALRGVPEFCRARYFRKDRDDAYVLSARVRRGVRFHQLNVLDGMRLRALGDYDAIFCRNLLIYLAPAQRRQVIELLASMLRPGGLLFVGHGELAMVTHSGLSQVDAPRAFALRRMPRPGSGGRVRRAAGKPVKRTQTPRATEQTLETPRDRLRRASLLADRGRLAEASKLCDDCLRLRADWPEAWLLRAMIDSARQDHGAAERALRKVLYLAPDHEEALLHLAFLLEARGETARAGTLRRRARAAAWRADA